MSGEDAPDLIATAPVRPGMILRAKVEAVLGSIAVVSAPLLFMLGLAPPWAALTTAVMILAAALEADGGVLVVCDIDGGEVPLLDPQLVGALTRATILVECHGPAESPTEPVMVHRFLPTHDVRRFGVEDRALSHLPAGIAEPWRSRMPRTLEALMQEHRTLPQSWLLLTPRG